jgi:hypothetical protein
MTNMKKLTSFEEHLDIQYGEKGNSKRDKFENDSSEFRLSNMKIEFLFMQNCPNVSPMWDSLQSALKELQLNQPIEKLDLNALSEKQDKRAGYGSPTILVNGKDLFGSPLHETYNPSCRYYPYGLPGTKQIIAKLKSDID